MASLVDAARSAAALAALRLEVAGKRGPLQPLYAQLRTLSPEARRERGAALQLAKVRLGERLQRAEASAANAEAEAARRAGQFDLTLPGRRLPVGASHPLRVVEDRILQVLCGLGFSIAEGPLIEHDWFNFAALNMPADHPAREMQDTFFVRPDVVLRTHTSNVQIRTMVAQQPPLAVVAPGMVFRNDEVDATHTPVFHQIEGLWLDATASFAELKGVLRSLLSDLFGEQSRVRFRPSFFPFTEPSCEVDVSCSACVGKGGSTSLPCRMCRGSGWLEILGAGMVDPAVLDNVGYDAERVQGFAFGIGLERVAMLLYGIEDIRLFYDNDVRFLAAFGPQLPAPLAMAHAAEAFRAG